MADPKTFDVDPKRNPTAFRNAVQRVATMAVSAPDSMVDEGLNWYPSVHDATVRQSRALGISSRQGAGIVAAVSPNMDFEANNINALDEIQNFTPEHWYMIHRSANQPRRVNPDTGKTSSASRIPEVGAMIREIAPSLSTAPDANLIKANRILSGENFDEVLSRRTAPKTNSFAHNIDDPSNRNIVTIDGRQADIIANSMRPWTWSGRNISSADLTKGRTSRYENHEEVMRRASSAASRIDPRLHDVVPAHLQAITWLAGKAHELSFPTASGKPRSQGPSRQGQKYA
jgi:hypothetical protein